jgi:hypothetical protein
LGYRSLNVLIRFRPKPYGKNLVDHSLFRRYGRCFLADNPLFFRCYFAVLALCKMQNIFLYQ